MTWIDWVVFVAFLVWVVSDGIRRARGVGTLEGYFAGRRAIPWWAAGLSVMATQASAITVIGTTGQGHDSGMDFVQIYLGLPFAMVLLCIFLVPVFRAAPILTAYEYLERRFGPATRSMASAIFLVSRCLAFGVVIYAPAVVLSALLRLDLTTTVVVIGVLTTLYTLVGGVNAVIWTDVKQMSVILGGLLLCLVILLLRILEHFDLGEALEVVGAAGKLNVIESEPAHSGIVPRLAGDEDGTPSFWEEKYNLWSGLLGGLFLHLAYFGCDQSQVQRILTNPTARESRMALLLSAFAKVPMQLVVLFIGVLLWLFYSLHPGPMLFSPVDQARAARVPAVAAVAEDYEELRTRRLALARELVDAGDEDQRAAALARFQANVRAGRMLRTRAAALLEPPPPPVAGQPPPKPREPQDTNYVFPFFILRELPPVLLGLIVAAIFAAAMSSADSALNSLTSATIVDFYRRWVRPDADERRSILASRLCTLLWGSAATASALVLEGGGSIVEWVNQIGSFFYGSLLGVFALALICPRAGARAGLLGLLGGMTSVLLVELTLEVEYLWYNVIGCLGVLAVGFAVAWGGLERRR